MGTFRHHPDSIIYINSLALPLAFWLTLEEGYSLPESYLGRTYEQGAHHFLRTGTTSIPQALEWPEGDAYIANESVYASAYEAYLESLVVPPTQTEIDEQNRRTETKTQFQQLTTGLAGLSTADRSYVILGRIMAFKDGANTNVIQAIVDRATAQQYVTSKPEWAGITAATKAWEADVLETLTGIVQVMMLVLE
jgi:hypothetical protein